VERTQAHGGKHKCKKQEQTNHISQMS